MEVLVVIDFRATRLPSDNFTCWFKSNLCLDLLVVLFADGDMFCGWGITFPSSISSTRNSSVIEFPRIIGSEPEEP